MKDTAKRDWGTNHQCNSNQGNECDRMSWKVLFKHIVIPLMLKKINFNIIHKNISKADPRWLKSMIWYIGYFHPSELKRGQKVYWDIQELWK